MFKKNEVVSTVNGLYGALTENLNTLCANRVAVVKGIASQNSEEAFATVEDINSSMTLLVKNTMYNGVSVGFVSRISGNEIDGKLTSVDLTISSQRNAGYKFRRQTTIPVDDKITEKMAEVYRNAAVDLLYGAYAYSNVDELNTVFASFTEDCKLKVKFTVSADYISDIDNSCVTFGVDVAEALNLAETADKLIYGGAEDSFKKAIVDTTREEFVEFLNSTPNTVSLVSAKNSVIADITGVTVKRRADKYIRSYVHKNAKYLNTCKNGIGYFRETVGDIDVFAVIAKDENGLRVVLNPYDIESNLNVDVDVLSLINK